MAAVVESTVLARWRGRLAARLIVERAAKAKHLAAARALTRARKLDAHPRKQLIVALDKARDELEEARRSVASARRVIARQKAGTHVSSPVEPIHAASWGWHPGVHDGVDVMADWRDEVVAICDGVIERADASGWWGKGARPTNGHPISDGDGIIVLRCTTDAGPFKPGLIIGYGHTEGASVKPGQRVKAGQTIGTIGWANGGHIHLMVRGPLARDKTGFFSGVGDRDPKPFLNWAIAHTPR